MKMKSDIAISVSGVSKNFKLPHENISSLKNFFTQGLHQKDKGFEVQHALRDISFEVRKGEFFGIVGRNGSGKSTLLKILAEIYQPSSGSIKTQGKLVPFIELGVGFNPELTGRENVYLNGALLGFTTKEIDGFYEDIVAFAELERFMDQKLKNYSSGMQVRLAFSVATRAKADILLVDEVLAVGDADFQRKCFTYFKQLKKQGTTVVFVTHDMASVREYCDRVIMIEKSRLVHEGSPEKVSAQYTKLFQTDSSSSGDSENTTRWGDGLVKIDNIDLRKKILKDGEKTLSFSTNITSNEDLDSLVVGFILKDASGRALLGTNTLLRGKKIKSIKKNEHITIDWSIPNIFREGDYTFDVAVNHANGIDVHDWWQDAAKITVYSSNYSQYLVNPEIDVEVKR